MRTNKITGEKNTETRRELAERYFSTLCNEPYEKDIIAQQYGKDNMGIITLLSDLQQTMEFWKNSLPEKAYRDNVEYYRVVLNDIKLILMRDARQREEERKVARIEITEVGNEYFVNYYKDDKNFGFNEGTKNVNQILKNVEDAIKTLNENKR